MKTKKNTNKFLSVLVILTLVLTSTAVTFAGGADPTSQKKGIAVSSGIADFKGGTAVANNLKGKAAPAANLTSKNPAPKGIGTMALTELPYHDKVSAFNESFPYPETVVYQGGTGVVGTKPGVIRDLGTVKKGCLELDALNFTTEHVKIGIYKDAACTGEPVAFEMVTPEYLKKYEDRGEYTYVSVPVAVEDHYYAAIYTDGGSVTGPQYVEAAVYFYSAADRTIVDDTYYGIGHGSTPQTNYFKFKATQTGLASVGIYSGGDTAVGTITLCDSNQKALSNNVKFDVYGEWGDAVDFGVKKGTTYYIKVVMKSLTNAGGTDGLYVVGVNTWSAPGLGGKTMATAKKLPNKSFKLGTIVAGSSQAHWYKFDITKKKVTLDLDGYTNKKIVVTMILIKGNKKETKTISLTRNNPWKSRVFKNKQGYTCYIKISRGDKQSSGMFGLFRK